MIFLISLQLLVLVVRDPSVRSRGCSVEVPFCGFSAALVGGGSMLFSFVLSEDDGLFASVDWQTALPPIPGKATAKTLRFLVEGNASRNWRNSLFFTRLFNVSSQNNHHTENAKITWFNNQQQKGI